LKPGAYLGDSSGSVRRCAKLPPRVLRIYDTIEGRRVWVSAQSERAPVEIFQRRGSVWIVKELANRSIRTVNESHLLLLLQTSITA
jgi:hypothetical protein